MQKAPPSYYAPARHSNRLHPRKNAQTRGRLTRDFHFLSGASHMTLSRSLLLLVSVADRSAAVITGPARPETAVKREPFGKMPDGQAVELFTLTNANGVEVRAITYGGIITSLRVPDRTGKLDDIVLGFDTPRRLSEGPSPFFGAIIGRYGNRIAKGAVHARRQDLQARDQQRAEPPARRHQGVRQGAVDGGAGGRQQCASRSRGPARTAKRAIPGNLRVAGHLHPDRQERARSSTTTPRPTRRRRSTSRSTATSTWRARRPATSSATS